MIRRPPRSTQSRSSAASDVYKRSVEGDHRLLERRRRVKPVGVEDIDVLEAQSTEALVEAGGQVLARAPVAIWSRPHVVAGLRGDDQLVPVAAQVRGENSTEVLLRGTVRRPVVVGQVEMGDPQVEGPANHRSLAVDRPIVSEVLP